MIQHVREGALKPWGWYWSSGRSGNVGFGPSVLRFADDECVGFELFVQFGPWVVVVGKLRQP